MKFPRLFRQEPSRPAAGSAWEGATLWTTDPTIGHGYYALNDDGTPNLDVRLTWVDDAPGDSENGSGHFVVADAGTPYYTHMPLSLLPANKKRVDLEAEAHGSSGVSM